LGTVREAAQVKRAVFIDRDGTISEEVGYIRDLNQFHLMPHSAEAIKLMNEHGLKVIMVTNQSGVARGYFTEALVKKVHKKMESLLSEQGAYLDAIYYCPHYPEGVVKFYCKVCECRKPATGLLEQASQTHDIDLAASYLVGDKVTDIELAHRVGAKAVLVLTGYGPEELKKIHGGALPQPAYVAIDLYDAARWIVRDLGA